MFEKSKKMLFWPFTKENLLIKRLKYYRLHMNVVDL